MNVAKRPVKKYNFKPFGAAIKAARKGHKESRNRVSDEMYISPRYLANIENKGQHPSLQIFYELMSRYHISLDQFLFGDTTDGKSTARRQLDALTMAPISARWRLTVISSTPIPRRSRRLSLGRCRRRKPMRSGCSLQKKSWAASMNLSLLPT